MSAWVIPILFPLTAVLLSLPVGLYLAWILDGRYSADEPTLIVRRRRGKNWLKPRTIAYGETYTTPLLPGFELVIDPRR